MRAQTIRCEAPPERVWALIAQPKRWSEWSPHVRGAEGLGSPEVVAGMRGNVILRGGVRVSAEVTAVTPGESWSWQVGGLRIRHTVREEGAGSRIEQEVEGATRAWSLLAATYAPVVGLVSRNIARVAELEA